MIYFLVILLISGGLIGYWYFFDRNPVEHPSPQYIEPALDFQSVDWDAFNEQLLKIGHIGFFEQYPLHVYAEILGIDIFGLEAKYNNEEGFENLTSDLVNRFHEDQTLFDMFSDDMVRDNMDLNLMMIDTYNQYSGMEDHSFSNHHHDTHNNDF